MPVVTDGEEYNWVAWQRGCVCQARHTASRQAICHAVPITVREGQVVFAIETFKENTVNRMILKSCASPKSRSAVESGG